MDDGTVELVGWNEDGHWTRQQGRDEGESVWRDVQETLFTGTGRVRSADGLMHPGGRARTNLAVLRRTPREDGPRILLVHPAQGTGDWSLPTGKKGTIRGRAHPAAAVNAEVWGGEREGGRCTTARGLHDRGVP